MTTKPVFSLLPLCFTIVSCKKEKKSNPDIGDPKKVAYEADILQLSEDEKYDKVLGALVGSAIGDAMGASTEMWHRNEIQLKYGYITGLTPAVRPQSPEGTWRNNLVAGATTDDTRWKYLMAQYLTKNKDATDADHFAQFITDYYQHMVKGLEDKELLDDTGILDEKIKKIDWIKEWARVSLAYQEGPKAYLKALNRFYGGEMSCAGQLYSPMFGIIAPNAETAYTHAYEHSIFDLGYAKDITSLVAAMTHIAMRTATMDSIINTATFVDPNGYQDSRLVGRIPYSVADASVKKVLSVKQMLIEDSLIDKEYPSYHMPKSFTGTKKDWIRQEMLYRYLEKDEKAIAFHSGEIWQILITAFAFGEGDFEKTLQFIINYGRDNDTVGAVAGMILGAKDGYKNLPVKLRDEVLRGSKEVMNIDLEKSAQELVEIMP